MNLAKRLMLVVGYCHSKVEPFKRTAYPRQKFMKRHGNDSEEGFGNGNVSATEVRDFNGVFWYSKHGISDKLVNECIFRYNRRRKNA